VDRQGPPPSIHLTMNATHGRVLEEFLGDLCVTMATVRAAGRAGAAGVYGTVE
jgi:hypothetical protein